VNIDIYKNEGILNFLP